MKQKLLIAALIISNVVCFYYLHRASYYKETNTLNVAPVASIKDSCYKYYSIPQHSIVFFGNSLTQLFDLNELFHRADLINRGTGGDRLIDGLSKVDMIIKAQPSKLFIEFGINDIINKIPFDTIEKEYVELIDTIKDNSPNTSIFIQGILPVSNNLPYNEEINKLNNWLQKTFTSCTYIDLSSLNKYWVDGIHINGVGYLLWASLLQKYIT